MEDMNKQSKRFYEILDVIKEFQDNAKKDENGEFEEWDANYPFKVAFLQEFITFCSESGGFSIG